MCTLFRIISNTVCYGRGINPRKPSLKLRTACEIAKRAEVKAQLKNPDCVNKIIKTKCFLNGLILMGAFPKSH